MGCPDASDLSDFVAGTAAGALRATIETHVDGCDECRRTIAMLVRARGVATQPTENPALAHTEVEGVSAAPPGRALAPGSRIGRYVLKEVIGRGGMGVVYAADDPELDREVAIKLVRPELARSLPSTRQRIVREAQAMAKLSHPSVIAVFDAGTAGDDVFIAMERVRGKNLRRWLTAEPRSHAEILEVFLDAGRGLAAAHAAGLVHRDFKPDNVLVGDDGRVRVTDFGLAEPVPIEGSDSAPGDGEEIVGTPAYMAPEQHEGRSADPRSDQFSFCVALYEALFGDRPFPGRTRSTVAAAVASGRIATPPAGARVPGSLRSIIARGLAVRPGDRFPTMDDLLRALGRDRGRLPRRIAQGAAVALVIVSIALFADWIVRGQSAEVTRTSFGAARSELASLLAARTNTFVALSDLSYVAPVMTDAAASVDQSDFGLGDVKDDKAHLALIHDSLRSASWVTFAKAEQGAEIGVADYKGRLLYASAEPNRWGDDVRGLPVIATAYQVASEEPQEAVIRGDDPALLATGLLGDQTREGLLVVFARATPIEGRPRALFVQISSGEKLLDEVSIEGTELALVAPDGSSVRNGDMSPDVVAAGRRAGLGVEEVVTGGDPWLVQRVSITSPGTGLPIADIVLARRADVGLATLFPGARAVLAVLALVLAGIVALGLVEAYRRDLSRGRT